MVLGHGVYIRLVKAAWTTCALAALLFVSAEATTYPKDAPEGWYRVSDPLVNADIVIEGRVVSVGEMEELSIQDISGEGDRDKIHRYAKVVVSIAHILKGYELVSATPGKFGFWVGERQLSADGGRAQRLNEGDRVVVCLDYRERFLGGRFVVMGARGIWVWKDAKWFEQDRPNRELYSSQLYRITDAARLQAVIRSSQLVVAGTVKSIQREDMNMDGTVMTVDRFTVKVTGVIKGSAGRDVQFIISRGKVYPDWYYASPIPSEIAVGDNWVFMLSPGSGGLHVTMGVNGMLRRMGDNLTRANRELWLRYTTGDLVDIAREQQRGH